MLRLTVGLVAAASLGFLATTCSAQVSQSPTASASPTSGGAASQSPSASASPSSGVAPASYSPSPSASASSAAAAVSTSPSATPTPTPSAVPPSGPASQALSDGVPVIGYSGAGNASFFTASWTAQSYNDVYQISVDLVYGSVITYVAANAPVGGFPGPSGTGLASNAVQSGGGDVLLPFSLSTGCTVGVPCAIAIAVDGLVTSGYVITASSAQATTQLTGGTPTSGFVAAGALNYYSYTTQYANTQSLQFVVTMLSGDADLYVSVTITHPNPSASTWYANAYAGDEILVLTPGSAGWAPAPATYYVGVLGFTNASYTVMALETVNPDATVFLSDGIPQGGITPAGHTMSYYQYTLPALSTSVSPIDFAVVPAVGAVNLYISTYLSPTASYPKPICAVPAPSAPNGCASWSVDPASYTYSSANGGGLADFVTVPASALQPGTTIIVGVFATTPDSGSSGAPPSSFDVTATSQRGATRLQLGVGVQGIAPADGLKAYSFATTSYGFDLIVSASVLAGAVDIYVSEAGPAGPGNPNTYNTSGAGSGLASFAVVYIPFFSLSQNCRTNTLFGTPCYLYVGVRGFPGMVAPDAALYSITAALSGSTSAPTILSDGVQAIVNVAPSAAAYLVGTVNLANAPGGGALYVVSQDYTGLTTLYASLGPAGSGKGFATPANSYAADVTVSAAGGLEFGIFSAATVAAFGCATATCTLYVTAVGRGSAISNAGVYFQTGAATSALPNGGSPLPGALSPGSSQAYSSAVQDANGDWTITLLPSAGLVTAYISVQSPAAPGSLPTPASYQRRLAPWLGATQLTIPASDPQFCVSADNVVKAPPCTYLVNVVSTAAVDVSEYTVSAATSNAISSTTLSDGAPSTASVKDGVIAYFTYSTAASPVLIETDVFVGAVSVFVTNSYVPGLSPPSSLPSPANNSAICQWPASPWTTYFIQSTDPCFVPGQVTYTIGVLGAVGAPRAVSNFVVTATSNAFLIRTLQLGVPRAGTFGQANSNGNFSFTLPSTTDDLIVTASPSGGQISVLLAFYDPANPVLPSCSKGGGGQQVVCTGWTWWATGLSGASSLFIPAADPCSAYSGSGLPQPRVNASTCANQRLTGMALAVVVYAFVDSLYVVSAQVGGSAMSLASGYPQLLITSDATFCNPRGPISGLCPAAPAPAVASAATVVFTVPASLPQTDQYLLVERMCADDQSGYCGSPLVMYASSCVASVCSTNDAAPYWGYNTSSGVVVDVSGAVSLPACSSTGPRASADPCVYTVSVMPRCAPGVPGQPGVACADELVRVTWAGVSDVERISSDCFALGLTCTLPPANTGGPGAVRRYEAFLGNQPTKAVLTLSACSGAVLVAVCRIGAASACNPANRPGPTNYDFLASTLGAVGGVVTYPLTQAGGIVVGLATDPDDPAAIADPQFSLVLSSGSGQRLTLPNGAPAPTVAFAITSATVATLNINWQAAVLQANGQQTLLANGAVYTVYAVPASSYAANDYNLGSVCGAQAAGTQPGGYANVVQVSTNQGTFVTLPVPYSAAANMTYSITLVATCAAGVCMPNGTQGQAVAYFPVSVTPYLPGPAPAPGPAPGNAAASGPSGGAIAGGIFGALFGVAVIGALVWVFVLKRALPNPLALCARSPSGSGYGQAHDSDAFEHSYSVGNAPNADVSDSGQGGSYGQL